MSKGCLILADNTDEFDYVGLASLAKDRVEKFLNIPCIVLSQDTVTENTRTFPGRSGKFTWNNLNRTKAYELSPYDRTLLIDADFFIASDTLTPHIDGDFDFAMVRDMYNPATGAEFKPTLGNTKIRQLWATVMIFNKSDAAKSIFEMADHVLCHYPYYSRLYGFNSTPLRNDYAFTIACHILGGYGQTSYELKNYKMINCDFNTEIIEINEDDVLIGYAKEENKRHLQRLRKTDVHLQNKISLFECINV